MNNRITKENILLFTQSISSLLKAGLSLQDTLLICKKVNSNKQLINLCSRLSVEINNGKLLSEALKQFMPSFNFFYISLIRIGEESGAMSEVFFKLSEYLKTKKDIHDKLIQAITYPIIVLVTAIIVVILVITFVFPKLEEIFEAFMDNSVDIQNKMIQLRTSFVILLLVFLLLVLAIFVISILKKQNYKIKLFFDTLLLKLPIIGNFIKTINTNDFSFSMKILLVSHVSIDKALELSAKMLNNVAYREAIYSAREKIIKGFSFAEAFESKNVFLEYFITWIGISEQTGDVIGVFDQLNEYYKNETTNILSRIIINAEPIFIIITGVIILLLIAQIVIPIFKLLGTL